LDATLGLLLLLFYILSILGISAAITYAVVRIFPTERTPKKPDNTPDSGSSTRGEESAAGRLFRRAKREAT
jgi:hypothetical protein